jgi:nucleotide-binding universal stress UspA family protein
MYVAARAAWRDVEEKRLQRLIDELAPALPGTADVVWAPASCADPGRTIAQHARQWPADVLLMAATPPPGLWLGTLHRRVIRQAGCPVLLTPAPAAVAQEA